MNSRTNLVIALALCQFALGGCGRQVKNIEVEPIKVSFTKSTQSEKLSGVARDYRGGKVDGVILSFRSENPSVAKVDDSGVVKPVGNGSTAIIVEGADGVRGESFVKVCLPGDIICEPSDKLILRVGSGAPLRCHLTDCKGEKLSHNVEIKATDDTMLLKDDVSFIGLKVGNTEVVAEAMGLTKRVSVQVDEQTFAPGMGPSAGGGRKGGGGGSATPAKDPNAKGAFDHILKNMKVSPD